MPGFIVRLAVNILALWVATALVPGVEIYGAGTFILAGILLGVVNALVRPILLLLTLPFTVLTLGLFVLVINAAMLGLVSVFLEDFTISGFPCLAPSWLWDRIHWHILILSEVFAAKIIFRIFHIFAFL